ncbi:CIA30 family protein [Rhodohalobacter sp.]|uniref:CIA30 family protein n=1 Tax=Rhodohalobacter sp. TaxID=1974210 RepID=UPI002ACD39B8|nr:CIA30 family protein [Rhodohalobacter sp.]MDZ7756764.1 CIA30 family protein [Rhodohalobacter sp.]
MPTTTSIFITSLFFVMLLPNFGSELKSSDPVKNNNTEQILIDFSNTSVAGWRIVNDSVMGGISRSTLQLHEDGYAVFSGTVSLENNGGFASIRTRAQTPVDLSGFDGLSVHVLGDGKTYSLRLRTVKNGRLTRYSYEARFATTAGEWETHKLAYSDFSPVFRGDAVRGNPELNPDTVLEIGFMIQDGQEGPFSLGVQRLSAYRTVSEK